MPKMYEIDGVPAGEYEPYSFEESYFINLWYNGYEDKIESVLSWLRNNSDYVNNEKYNSLDIADISKIDSDDPIKFVLMGLVQMYGDYGTSPRSGWIHDVDGAIEYLESMREYWGTR